ncbi:MAG: prephenate dehydratase [Candidatus Binatia bacterium]|nr:MAG: prephenate dehydratase [Candidatus Binatia bacterium]
MRRDTAVPGRKRNAGPGRARKIEPASTPPGDSRSLAALRAEIDRVDREILTWLNRRAELARQIGEKKASARLGAFAPEREKKILARLAEENPGPLRPEMVRAIFRQIIASCRSLEQPLRVAYLGPEGTFSHRAAYEQFGAASELVPVDSIEAVFDEVEHGRADYGVVPVENSTHGVVAATLDRFVPSEVTIRAERLFAIRLLLLSRSGLPERVRRIVSMEQPLAQCRRWLAEHFPGVPVEPVASTAVAASLAARDDRVAAVAGELAAELYGLRVVAEAIQDEARNVTRFLVIGRDGIGPRSGDDKTTLLFLVRHEAGALERVLRPFARAGVNLLSLESRPLRGRPWEYVFFLDVEGHVSEPRLSRVLRRLEPACVSLRVLGSYPVSRVIE